MDCPQLPTEQSTANAKKRLDNAVNVLGKDVLVRLLIYTLYLLGFKRETLAKMFGYQLAGIKSIIDRISEYGLEGLIDQRRTTKEPKQLKPAVSVTDSEATVSIPESLNITVSKDDHLARKVLAVCLVEAGAISASQGACYLGYTPQAFSRLLKRYREKGSTELLDKRRGQQRDYKVDLDVKSEILYQFLKLSSQNTTFSSRDIHRAVTKAFPEKKISERTVRYHLTLLGFSQVHRRLKEELFGGKKN